MKQEEKLSQKYWEKCSFVPDTGMYCTALEDEYKPIYDQLVSLEARINLLEALNPTEQIANLLNINKRELDRLVQENKL